MRDDRGRPYFWLGAGGEEEIGAEGRGGSLSYSEPLWTIMRRAEDGRSIVAIDTPMPIADADKALARLHQGSNRTYWLEPYQ